MNLTAAEITALSKKRWLVLAVSCLINICIGSMYAWSSLSAPMAQELNANLSSVFSTANAVSFITMIIGGLLNDKYEVTGVRAHDSLLIGNARLVAFLLTNGIVDSHFREETGNIGFSLTLKEIWLIVRSEMRCGDCVKKRET